jgi:putative flippase GtrA
MVQAMKFGLVGVLNTGITLGMIFVLMKGLRVHYALSNCIGYALGFLSSFVFNKKWTFQSKGNVSREGVLFGAVFGVCYLIQLGALLLMKETMNIKADYAQLLAIAVYTGLNFMLNKLITFKNG